MPSTPTTTPAGQIPRASDQVQFQAYTDGSVSADDYQLEPGVCVLPLAEDPPTDINQLKAWSPVVVMRLHAPYRIRRAVSATRKQSNPPIVPAPTDTGKFVFLGGTLSVGNQQNSTLVNYDWTVTTEFMFVENCVSRIEDGFVLGSTPWTQATTVTNAMQFPGVPELGAVSAAGADAKAGYFQANSLNLSAFWRYNCPTFYPGVLMSADMANAGAATVPPGFIP